MLWFSPASICWASLLTVRYLHTAQRILKKNYPPQPVYPAAIWQNEEGSNAVPPDSGAVCFLGQFSYYSLLVQYIYKIWICHKTLCYMSTIKSYISLQQPARSLLLLILSLFLLILTQVFSVRLLLVTGYIFHSSFNSRGRRLMAPSQRKSRVHDPSCVTGFHWFFPPSPICTQDGEFGQKPFWLNSQGYIYSFVNTNKYFTSLQIKNSAL